ncbi:MAG: hypothetical protein AAF393_13180 [Pseudomonadota bacterium]
MLHRKDRPAASARGCRVSEVEKVHDGFVRELSVRAAQDFGSAANGRFDGPHRSILTDP